MRKTKHFDNCPWFQSHCVWGKLQSSSLFSSPSQDLSGDSQFSKYCKSIICFSVLVCIQVLNRYKEWFLRLMISPSESAVCRRSNDRRRDYSAEWWRWTRWWWARRGQHGGTRYRGDYAIPSLFVDKGIFIQNYAVPSFSLFSAIHLCLRKSLIHFDTFIVNLSLYYYKLQNAYMLLKILNGTVANCTSVIS